ncbi:MAG: hypothetical protein CVU50_05255 [Candidatus Cloacimonetes bacterium HGW-Cloacimonetes-3]|jgi:hypothetical protein|nr:MAG: hypothetical protein CVU50_05255 [Candidatus Cloacimonetes bacterium HGW-Cloacimonetes-3]
MDSFKKYVLWMVVISVGLIAVSGCTKKNNLTGNNWSNANAKTIYDSNGIVNGFSFPSDTLRVITGSEVKLLTGDYQGAQATAYMRFTGMLRQSLIAEADVDSCYVKLSLVKRSPVTANKLKLQLFKINSAWNDTLAQMSNMEYIVGSEVEVADSVSIYGTLVKLKLPPEMVKTWETNADSTGLNLAVKVVDNGFVEIESAQGTIVPVLNLKYKKTLESAFEVFSTNALIDNYTLSETQDASSPNWIINNSKATRMYLKWVPTNSLFTDNDGSPLSSVDIQRLTVNRAVIVLHAKTNNYYAGVSSFSMYPFNLTRSDISITSPPLMADYEIIKYTPISSGTIVGDSLEVDVTPLVQAFVSGEKLPLGISIQSTQERQNMGFIEFYDFSAATPANKKPYLRISYTPPYLKQ